jgi:hypothetical protein
MTERHWQGRVLEEEKLHNSRRKASNNDHCGLDALGGFQTQGLSLEVKVFEVRERGVTSFWVNQKWARWL